MNEPMITVYSREDGRLIKWETQEELQGRNTVKELSNPYRVGVVRFLKNGQLWCMLTDGEEGVALYKNIPIDPCPFCGSWDVRPDNNITIHSDYDQEYRWVKCNRCHSKGPMINGTKSDSIKLWNKRYDGEAKDMVE